MQDIPLKVLIIDPSQSDADALRHALEDIEIILSIEYISSFKYAFNVIDKKDINAIYIDPISPGLDPASDFIFQVRSRHPGIVFVLFYDFEKQESIENQFYSGERRRFHHYFKLDKRTPGPEFLPEVLATVRACQSDLSLSLTHGNNLPGTLSGIILPLNFSFFLNFVDSPEYLHYTFHGG